MEWFSEPPWGVPSLMRWNLLPVLVDIAFAPEGRDYRNRLKMRWDCPMVLKNENQMHIRCLLCCTRSIFTTKTRYPVFSTTQ